jgi:hypothetical protein
MFMVGGGFEVAGASPNEVGHQGIKPPNPTGTAHKTDANIVLPDRTLGSRYELKYLISKSKAKEIEEFVKLHLPQDRYSKLQPDGFYPIVSLYLDSDDMQLCVESITGKLNRYKLRIRSYTDDTAYPRFFEIKRRANTVIVKSRYRAKHHDVKDLLAGKYMHPQYYSTDGAILRQFQLYAGSIQAKPKVLIRYNRKAYEGDSHTRVRVTFDADLSYRVTDKPEVTLNGSGWRYHGICLQNVILEIKFNGRYPGWLSTMAKCFELRQESISKYANSIKESCALGFCSPRLPMEMF